jgi:hypothetical protein
LGGGGPLGVVQVTEHDQAAVLRVPAEDAGGGDADGGGFGGAPVQGVGREPGPFVLVGGVEPAAREGQQFGLQVRGDHIPRLAAEVVQVDVQGAATHPAGVVAGGVADLHGPQRGGEAHHLLGR